MISTSLTTRWRCWRRWNPRRPSKLASSMEGRCCESGPRRARWYSSINAPPSSRRRRRPTASCALCCYQWGARCEDTSSAAAAPPSVVGPVAQTLLHLYLEAREREKALKLLGRPDLGGALDDDMAMLLCEQFDFATAPSCCSSAAAGTSTSLAS